MKVILLKNVSGLGRRGDLKEVSDGYSRNFLLPRGLAEAATVKNISLVKAQEDAKVRVKVQAENKLEKLARKLNGLVLEIQEKVSEANKFYAAISKNTIVNKLKERGITVSKEQILLAEPIKEPGKYKIAVHLGPSLATEIIVVAKA